MNEIVELGLQVTTLSGTELYGDIRWNRKYLETLGGRLPVLIVCHGFKAFKDWGPFPAIGRALADDGFVSIVFNFSHNGVGKAVHKFSEREKFSINTLSLELEDVGAILDAISSGQTGCPCINPSKIGIIGHSRGGGIAIIKAKEDRRIKAVAGWSSVSYFNRYTEAQRRRWREKGYVELSSINPLNPFRLTTALLDDLEQNEERLNIARAVETLQKPLLLIHGTADIPVPIEEAKQLYKVSDKTMSEFISLDGVGHMYGARHPYKKSSPSMTHVLEMTSAWFHKHL